MGKNIVHVSEFQNKFYVVFAKNNAFASDVDLKYSKFSVVFT